jgi:hypothetical protein
MFLDHCFNRATPRVACLWQFELLPIWQVVRFVVLRRYFFYRVTKLGCFQPQTAFANFFLEDVARILFLDYFLKLRRVQALI